MLDDMNNSSYKILKSTRHNKKLRKGVIKSNHFKIKVTDLSDEINSATFIQLKTTGFPNYFGYQRFGHSGNNLTQALRLFNNEIRVRSRNKKGLYLSAARSYLFNLIVAERIKQHSWKRVLKGDCLSLSGSHSYFTCEQVDREIEQRLETGDVHVSGVLVGSQKSQALGEALQVEELILKQHKIWVEGLDKARLSTARRPMRVLPQDLTLVNIDKNTVIIEFSLPPGSFATSLLRELFIINDAAVRGGNKDIVNSETVDD